MPRRKRKKRKKTKSWINKRALKLYFAIILVCVVVAWVLAFIVGRAPTVTSKIEKNIIEEVERKTGRKIDADTVEEFKKSFKGNIEDMDIEKLKESYNKLKKRKEQP